MGGSGVRFACRSELDRGSRSAGAGEREGGEVSIARDCHQAASATALYLRMDPTARHLGALATAHRETAIHVSRAASSQKLRERGGTHLTGSDGALELNQSGRPRRGVFGGRGAWRRRSVDAGGWASLVGLLARRRGLKQIANLD